MDNSPGALALVGSGEYLPVMADLEKWLLEQAIVRGKSNRFVQIPTAAGLESPESLNYWKELGRKQAERIGAEQIFLPIFNREGAMDESHIDVIHNAGLIYLSGGNPIHLAQSLVDTPVWNAIKFNWENGSSLAGCSAGAMAMSSDVPHFFRMKEEGDPGLGITPHIRTIPHYNKFFGWIPDKAAKVMMKAPEGVVIVGIDEDTAMVCESGTSSWKVIGKGSVHILLGAPTQKHSAGEIFNLES